MQELREFQVLFKGHIVRFTTNSTNKGILSFAELTSGHAFVPTSIVCKPDDANIPVVQYDLRLSDEGVFQLHGRVGQLRLHSKVLLTGRRQ